MPITKEALEQRLASAVTSKEQAVSQANAFEGIIIDCQYWLAILAQAEPAEADLQAAEGEHIDVQRNRR